MKYLVTLLAVLVFLFPFLLQHPYYEPHRDEFLYLAEAHHLAWGYLEAPPAMSLLATLVNAFGGSIFWIKFWPALFGALTFVVASRLVLDLGGRSFALLLGFLPFVCGYFPHVFFMFQPNFLEVFFWTLMAYGLILHARSGSPGGLYIAGVAWGLGMMSKYSVSLFALSLLGGILLTGQRSVLRNRHFYLSFLVGFLVFLPNFLWQVVHGFPIIFHMKELERQQLASVSRTGFLRDQVFRNLPALFVWITGWLWVSLRPGGRPYRFIGWATFLAIAFLLAARGKNYYAMGIYPVLVAFGAVRLEYLTKVRGRLKGTWPLLIRATLVVYIIATGFIVDMIAVPTLRPEALARFYARYPLYRELGCLEWEDHKDHPLPQDFADMLSWRELTRKVATVYQSLSPAERKSVVLDGDNYGVSGAVDYYGQGYRLPPVMGHSASYLLWTPPDFSQHDVVILFTDNRDEIHADFVREFRYAAVEDSIQNPYAREYRSIVLLLKGPSESFRKNWKDYYDGLKSKAGSFR